MVTSTMNFGADVGVNATTTPHIAARPRRFARVLQALWRTGERIGQQRGAAYLNNLADICADTRPEFARRMRAAANGTDFD